MSTGLQVYRSTGLQVYSTLLAQSAYTKHALQSRQCKHQAPVMSHLRRLSNHQKDHTMGSPIACLMLGRRQR